MESNAVHRVCMKTKRPCEPSVHSLLYAYYWRSKNETNFSLFLAEDSPPLRVQHSSHSDFLKIIAPAMLPFPSLGNKLSLSTDYSYSKLIQQSVKTLLESTD